MAIFDSKQEILDIKLTFHGRNKLANGVFRPFYYAFFDDGVLYDAAYASGSDTPNGGADERIRTQTPYLKTQSSLLGSEVKLSTENVNQDVVSKITSYETENLVKYPLGNSKLGEVTGSYLDFKMLGGRAYITNVATTGSLYKFKGKEAFDLKDPKLEIGDLKFVPRFRNIPSQDLTTPPQNIDPDSSVPPSVSPILEDGRYINVEIDDLLLSLSEEKTVPSMKNFDISVYKINTNNEGSEEYEELTFANQTIDLVDENGFLRDPAEVRQAGRVEVTSKNVEYYFRISADEEIDPLLLSNRVPRDAMGNPIIDDPLIKTFSVDRTRARFDTTNKYDGDPC
jgi:hypothetical protein